MGHDDVPKSLPAAGAQHGCCFFLLLAQVLQHRLHGAHHEWQADKGERHHHAQRGVADLEGQILTNPAIGGVQGGQCNARYRRRQGKGQINHGIYQAAGRKVVTHQHPGHQQPEPGIEQRRNQRSAQGELVRRHDLRIGCNGPKARPPQLRRGNEYRSQRNQHDQRQVQHGNAQRKRKTGQHAVAAQQPGTAGLGCGNRGRKGGRNRSHYFCRAAMA